MGLLDIGQIAAAVDNIKRRTKIGLLDPALAFTRANEDAKASGDADYDRLQRQFKSALPETRAQAGQETRDQGYDLMTQLLGIGAIKYPQAEALETARKNAVKMLGLPENNTAADRAKALGFGPDMYHGTGGAEFAAFDPAFSRRSYMGRGTHMAEDAGLASNYAGQWRSGQRVMPVRHRAQNLAKEDQYTKADWRVRAENDDALDARMPVPHPNEEAAIADLLKKQGFDGVRYSHPAEMTLPGKSRMTDVVFDPAKIRSRFAAFDPARINDPDLLAALMAMGIGVPTVAGLLGGNE